MSNDTEISVELAKKILTACYELDSKLRQLAALTEKIEAHEIAQQLTTLVGAQMMVPIYFAHPELGRVMQPGDWLRPDLASSKFGV